MNDILEKLRKINESAIIFGKITETEKLYHAILERMEKIFSFSCGAILLLEDDGETLTIKASKGYNPEVVANFRGKKGVGITGMVLQKREPILVKDVKTHPLYVEGVKGALSELAAPLEVNGQILGVLDIESTSREAFDDLDMELFYAFTALSASSIRGTILLQQNLNKAKRLSLLHSVSRVIEVEHNLDTIISMVMDAMKNTFDISCCALLLMDKNETGVLRVKSSIGYGDVESLRIKLGEGITGKSALTGKPILVRDVRTSPDYIPGVKGGICEMCAPLIIKGEVVGVLDAESTRAGAFDESDLEFLSIFAAQVATAIYNARFIEQLEEANCKLSFNLEEMKKLNLMLEGYSQELKQANQALDRQVKQLLTLHKAGLTITSSLDLDTTLKRIVEMIGDIVETSVATIKLIDRETEQMNIRITSGKEKGGEVGSRVDLPLKIGDKTIGVFELASVKKMTEEEQRLLETLATQAAIAIENARLFEETQKTYYETLRALAGALEARDAYTRGHSERVANLAVKLAEKLGVPEDERREIYSVALLHDIGKIGIRDDILHKPSSLTEEEWKVIQEHPVFGDAILAPLRFLSRVAGMVKSHHERWDGTGYPDKLKGKEIPLASRIVAVADTFDALVSDRPYRNRRTKEEALREIKSESGKQFDPEVVAVLESCLED